MDDRPIAVFDSGAGGLTVAAEILRRLPGEDLLYLGDTARVPYGSRSVETIVRYALECVRFLLRRDPKALVIACNTVSAIALEPIVALSPVPVIDVVRPGARAAADFTRSGRVGVVATEATVRSQAYRRAILGLKPDAEVFQSAAPLLVPLAEEGWPPDGPVVRGALERYLGPLREARVDTVVLGCTHYPLLKPAFRAALDDDVFLVDSAEETGEALSRTLRERGWVRPAVKVPARRFLVTDNPERFRSLGARFLWDRTLEVEETAL